MAGYRFNYTFKFYCMLPKLFVFGWKQTSILSKFEIFCILLQVLRNSLEPNSYFTLKMDSDMSFRHSWQFYQSQSEHRNSVVQNTLFIVGLFIYFHVLIFSYLYEFLGQFSVADDSRACVFRLTVALRSVCTSQVSETSCVLLCSL